MKPNDATKATDMAQDDVDADLNPGWMRRWIRAEIVIVAIGLAVGLLVLPVNWPLGRWTWGMSEATRASLGSAALMSAAVAGALSIVEGRRRQEAHNRDSELREQTVRLADRHAIRLLNNIGHGYRMAVEEVGQEQATKDRSNPVGSWSAHDLELLAKTLTRFLTFGMPGPDEWHTDEGLDNFDGLVLTLHMSADVLSAAQGAGMAAPPPHTAHSQLVDIAQSAGEELSRLRDALLIQNDPRRANSIFDLQERIDRAWRIADLHLPWGADLAEDLVAWLTDRPNEDVTRESLALDRTLTGDEDADWIESPDSRRAWLDYHSRRLYESILSALHERVMTPEGTQGHRGGGDDNDG